MQAPARKARVRPRTDRWRRRFITIVLTVVSALQVPFVAMLQRIFVEQHAKLPLLWALAATFVVNVPLFYRLTHWVDEERASWPRVWLFETPYFVHFVATMMFGPVGLLLLAAAGVTSAIGRSDLASDLNRALLPTYVVAAAIATYGTLVRRFWTPIRTVEIPIQDLPAGLDGYTIVQLSDVHCGPYLPRAFYRRLARRATALHADAIVLTGDMITHGVSYLDDVRDFVSRLSARAGVFAALGNHDYFGTVHEVAEAMRAGGAAVLRNDGITVDHEREGGWFLAAVDDNWSRRDDLSKALAQRPPKRPCVVLAHDPETFPAIAERDDVDVVLSGHTHGGQFGVPFFAHRWNLARVRFRFTVGPYRLGRTTLYVHPGNGTSGPPVRVGVAPVIARLVLRRSS